MERFTASRCPRRAPLLALSEHAHFTMHSSVAQWKASKPFIPEKHGANRQTDLVAFSLGWTEQENYTGEEGWGETGFLPNSIRMTVTYVSENNNADTEVNTLLSGKKSRLNSRLLPYTGCESQGLSSDSTS